MFASLSTCFQCFSHWLGIEFVESHEKAVVDEISIAAAFFCFVRMIFSLTEIPSILSFGASDRVRSTHNNITLHSAGVCTRSE